MTFMAQFYESVVRLPAPLQHLQWQDAAEVGCTSFTFGEVGAFLRRKFLDPAGRHLIFSTHVPSSAGVDQLLGKGRRHPREAVAVAMPRSTQLPALMRSGTWTTNAQTDKLPSRLLRLHAFLIYSVQDAENVLQHPKEIPNNKCSYS
eukprot:s8512_g1.t1